MTPSERLKRLAELERKLGVTYVPRLYVRLDGGSWLGAGPPDGVPRPEDTVLDVVFVEPDGREAAAP